MRRFMLMWPLQFQEGIHGDVAGYSNSMNQSDQFENGFNMNTTDASKTGCSGNLLMGQDNIIANYSSTIAPCDGVAAGGSRISKRLQGGCIPSAEEIDNFFAAFELKQEKYFKEKYNFDFKNETPLPGRYEWVKVEP